MENCPMTKFGDSTDRARNGPLFAYDVPRDCYAVWTAMEPSEHYARLQNREDSDAWNHLLKIILCYLKYHYYLSTSIKTGIGYSDLAHDIWIKIAEKIGDGSLVMRVPSRFYNMVKKICERSIIDTYRRFGWRDIEYLYDICTKISSKNKVVKEDMLAILGDNNSPERRYEARLALLQLERAVAECPMTELERLAVQLSILLKTGRTALSNNRDIAAALSEYAGRQVEYGEAGRLIHQGWCRVKSYMDRLKRESLTRRRPR